MANYLAVLVGGGVLMLYFFMGKKFLLVLGGLLIAVMLLIYFNQNKLLYMPVIPGSSKSSSSNPRGWCHPSEKGIHSIDLNLNTSDGVIIRGWHMKFKDAKRIIIYFHENAGNIGTRLAYAKAMVERLSADVILVAYRGFSDSDSVPSEEGLMRDSYAVMEYAIEYANTNSHLPIYVLGRSLGGAVTINVGSQFVYQNSINGLILENTFTSIADMIDIVFPILKYFKFLQRNFWPSIDRISKCKELPILFVKSMQDELVPPAHMNRLIEQVKGAGATKIMQFQIKFGTHNESWSIEPDAYFSRLLDFVEKNKNKK